MAFDVLEWIHRMPFQFIGRSFPRRKTVRTPLNGQVILTTLNRVVEPQPTQGGEGGEALPGPDETPHNMPKYSDVIPYASAIMLNSEGKKVGESAVWGQCCIAA
jgi:hypothetical protein